MPGEYQPHGVGKIREGKGFGLPRGGSVVALPAVGSPQLSSGSGGNVGVHRAHIHVIPAGAFAFSPPSEGKRYVGRRAVHGEVAVEVHRAGAAVGVGVDGAAGYVGRTAASGGNGGAHIPLVGLGSVGKVPARKRSAQPGFKGFGKNSYSRLTTCYVGGKQQAAHQHQRIFNRFHFLLNKINQHLKNIYGNNIKSK